MNNERFNASPPGIVPESSSRITIRAGEVWSIKQESSKRQQCVRATELAERTGLEIRYAWLWSSGNGPCPVKDPGIMHSGKVFDECGRRSCKGIPGRKGDRVSCHWKQGCMIFFMPASEPLCTASNFYSRGGRTRTRKKGQEND